MKKIMATMLAVLMFISSFALAQPSQAQTMEVLIDGLTLETDQPPIVYQSRTMVPLRAIFEALGAKVTWTEGSGSIYCRRDGASISLKVNDSTAYINGERVTLDVPPLAVNGRTLVPVRVVSEALGATCEWVRESNRVYITSNDGYVGVMRVDYDALLPSELKKVSQSALGVIHNVRAIYENTSPYPIVDYKLIGSNKETGNRHYFTCYDTIMPGEDSPRMESLLARAEYVDDIQYQKLSVQLKTSYGKFRVEYDCRLQEIESVNKVTN